MNGVGASTVSEGFGDGGKGFSLGDNAELGVFECLFDRGYLFGVSDWAGWKVGEGDGLEREDADGFELGLSGFGEPRPFDGGTAVGFDDHLGILREVEEEEQVLGARFSDYTEGGLVGFDEGLVGDEAMEGAGGAGVADELAAFIGHALGVNQIFENLAVKRVSVGIWTESSEGPDDGHGQGRVYEGKQRRLKDLGGLAGKSRRQR